MRWFARLILCLAALAATATDACAQRKAKDPYTTAIRKKALRVLGERTRAHGNLAMWVAASPDGKLFATSDDNGLIRLWNAKTGKPVRDIEGHGEGVHGLVFVDGSKFLAAAGSNSIELFATKNGKSTKRYGHGGNGTARLAYHGGTKRFAVITENGRKITVVGRKKGVTRDIPFDVDRIRGVAFGADGTHVYAIGSDPHRVLAWDLAKNEVVANHPLPSWPTSLAVTPDGSELLVAEKKVLRFALPAMTEAGAFDLVNESIDGMQFAPDGSRLYLGCGAGSLCAHAWPSAERIYRNEISRGIPSMALGAGGETIATCFSWGGGMRFYAAKDGTLTLPLAGHQDLVRHVSWSPDGSHLLTGDGLGEVLVWNAKSGKRLHTLTEHAAGEIRGVFHVDAQHAWTAGTDRTFRLHDLGTKQPIREITVPAENRYPHTLAFDPDYSVAAVGYIQGVLEFFDCTDGKSLERITVVEGETIDDVCAAPDGSRVAFRIGGKVFVYDWESREQIHSFTAYPNGDVQKLAFVDADTLVHAGDLQGALVFSSATDGKELGRVNLASRHITALGVSDDRKRIAAASFGEIYLVDAKRRKKGKSTKATGDVTIVDLEFDPSGKLLAAGTQENLVLVVDMKKMPE